MGKQTSSRLTKKKKVNIIKKKKEKDRKIRKAAKNGIALPRNKLKKDLGIPNLLPDKKQILEKIYQKRQAEKQEKNELKAIRRLKKNNANKKLTDSPRWLTFNIWLNVNKWNLMLKKS
ncbi:hypothetical protein C9374_002013 [Naegleria lovaniensis]|uniref:Guanine nucleotide-binding protein-like 3 N-terminal domain-containing protein n=1 Tax=Naegleria lovaniensis TaxID=51637 RepID=A0AA88KLT6_NAELO|nr:uncharacterized protein C9374_002013 [Naegleria lovaniensis]KAG2386978.1 hypothetical protein C9374_002013 [Naegleria lovaniensis]